MTKIACVAVVKNEERHIAEWIAYQFAIGFDTVILYDNASTDGTVAVASKFARRRDLRILDWPASHPQYQNEAYDDAIARTGTEFDWLAFFDTDEFLVLDAGLSLKSVLKSSNAAAIAVSWAMFGSSGHEKMPNGLVIETFQRRAEAGFGPNQHVKSIIRPSRVKACLNAHMFDIEGDYSDLAGRPLKWQSNGVQASVPDYAVGKLHHYFTRSAAHWQAKMARGYHDTTRKQDVFQKYDRNEVFDNTAARYASDVARMIGSVNEPASTKIAVCVVVKNEEALILEWIAFHSIIGFDSFLILDDHSGDRTTDYARLAGQHLDVRVMPWLQTGRGKQGIAYETICRQFADEFAWVAFLDSDEFLVPQSPATIQTLLAAHGDSAAVAVPWAIFGSSGHVEKPAGLIIESFTHRAPDDFGPNLHVKSIVRPNRVVEGVNPHYFEVAGAYRLPNGDTAIWDTPGILARHAPNAGWRVQHYFTRSKSHWMDRMARGQLGSFTRTQAEFDEYDRNEIPDLTAAGYALRVSRKRAELLGSAMTSPTTAELSENVAALSRREIILAQIDALQTELATLDDLENVPPGNMEHNTAVLEISDVKAVEAEALPVSARVISNLALHQQAAQSSLSEWSFGASLTEDAAGAVNGKIDGTRKFHTGLEENPWWQVNLGQLSNIIEVRIHNTTDHTAARFRNFSLSVSGDGESWVELVRKQDGAVVGADSKPFIWRDHTGTHGRIVRVTLLDNNFLHLDQIEVYGVPIQTNDIIPVIIEASATTDLPSPFKTTVPENDLIYDIGMSEGNDTAFYLAKGFRVVGVEADVQMYFSLCERFAESIRDGRLIIHNMAAAERDGDIVEFFHHDLYQGLSGLSHGRAEFQEGNFSSYFVATVNWPALMNKHGVPHYLKIDIEGHEGPFLQSMAGVGAMPEYISVECHNLSPVEKLELLGYRKFKLIDQQPAGGFRLPTHQCEGRKIEWPKFDHASGPFGQDLPEGPWLAFEDFKQAFVAAQALHLPTWYDCHAWMPAT